MAATQTPEAAYEARRQEALELVARLHERLNIASTPDRLHWGHVGDLGRIIEVLREAAR